jgi:peptidyl-prolyl cis-trans isomerase D
VAKQLAQQRYAEAAEQFSNMVYEQSDSLQPVVDKLKLSKMTAVVQRAVAPGATGPLASSKLLDAVFSVDGLQNKRNTEAVETGPNQLVSARVVNYRPAHVRDLAEVRAQVLEQLKADQAAAAARKDGEARLASLKQNPADTLAQSVCCRGPRSRASRARWWMPRCRPTSPRARPWWVWTWAPRAMPC